MIDQKHAKFVKTFQDSCNGRQQFVLNFLVKISLPLLTNLQQGVFIPLTFSRHVNWREFCCGTSLWEKYFAENGFSRSNQLLITLFTVANPFYFQCEHLNSIIIIIFSSLITVQIERAAHLMTSVNGSSGFYGLIATLQSNGG